MNPIRGAAPPAPGLAGASLSVDVHAKDPAAFASWLQDDAAPAPAADLGESAAANLDEGALPQQEEDTGERALWWALLSAMTPSLPPLVGAARLDDKPQDDPIRLGAAVGAAAGGAAAPALREAAPQPKPEVPRFQVPLRQVSEALAAQVRGGGQRLVLHIDNPDLGALDVSVQVRGGVVHLTLRGEQATLASVGHTLHGLADNLRAAGLRLGGVRMRPLSRRNAISRLSEPDDDTSALPPGSVEVIA